MSSLTLKLFSFLCIICSMSSIHALLAGSTRIVGIQSRTARTSGVLSHGLLPTRSSRLFSTIDEALKVALAKPHPYRNITPVILEKVGKYLHRNDKHPLGIIKSKIEEYCNVYTKEKGQTPFAIFDNLSPLVNTKNCFDDLRVGPDHPSRRQSDTYYVTGAQQVILRSQYFLRAKSIAVNVILILLFLLYLLYSLLVCDETDTEVLRTHTSAHQSTLISGGEAAFICTGDVYRRDEIDATHYPVFHQMEGVRIFQDKDLPAGTV